MLVFIQDESDQMQETRRFIESTVATTLPWFCFILEFQPKYIHSNRNSILRMPLFAAGAAAPDAVEKYSDKKSAKFEGSIDPMTMLAVIRAQNESEEKIKSDLIDPIIDMTGSDKDSFKIRQNYDFVTWRVEFSAQKILKP